MLSRSVRNGWLKSVLACATCAITLRIRRAYGREAFIRSCARRILAAETISSARVTLRMFCVLLILVLISRPLAMLYSLALLARGIRDEGIRDSSEPRPAAFTNP